MSATDSLVTSAASSEFPGLFQHMLRKKYKDPATLKDYLDDAFGEDKYQVVVSFAQS
jgi:hypothetical protein